LVHDKVEKALLKEIETVRNCEKKLEQFMDKCVNQVRLSIIYSIDFEKFAQYCFSVNKQQSYTTSAAD